ncbi:MAG: ParM/StbA family protein [Anaerostipes sp.]|jgi:plasmid segregation protein ParM
MKENNAKEVFYMGIDYGNHLMKGANHIMENGVAALETKPTFATNTLVYDGKFYKVGENRGSVKDSKLDDDDYYLLTLALMAKEAVTRGIPYGAHVILGIGMPLKQFATVRKQFVRYLMRDRQPVRFRYEDQAYEFFIEDVMAFPQCYAAVADQLAIMQGECLIVDVGSWTIDIMAVRKGVPIESQCETFTESMISVIQDIKSRTSELYGKELSESKITEYISNQNAPIPDKYRKLMDEAFRRFTDRVEGILKENGHDTEFSDVIYVGGGAIVMKNYGKHSDNIRYIEDVRANARGYEYLVKQMRS